MDVSNPPSFAHIELARLSALLDLDILDTPTERDFDDITRLAATALGVASAAVSLIDEKRQWFKSRHGIPFSETPRDISFCTHAVASRDILVVPDATQDNRFSSNPLVTPEGGIRFYAGVPLIISSGQCLGTLCVFDPSVRDGLTETQGTIVYWNPAAERMFGYLRGEAVGQNVEIVIPPRLATGHQESEFPIELSLARWGAGPPDGGFAVVVRDITARKALERERAQAQTFLNTVVSNLPVMLFFKDAQTREYVLVNRAGEEAIGRPANEIVGHTDRDLFPDYGDGYEERDSEAIASPSGTLFESEFVRNDGQSVHLRTTRTLIDGPDRPEQYVLGISENVTETRLAEAEVLRLAHYDALTGLLNRASFTDRLHGLVRKVEPFAMLSIDLDRFKAVNDQFGHPVGDAVLTQVGDRLRAMVQSPDWVARIGGDELVAVLTGTRLRERADEVATAILTIISEPFTTGRVSAHVGASIGIVLFPEDGRPTGQLCENADLALYRAKQMGKGKACFFDVEMDATAQDRRTLEIELREVIEKDRIDLAYQPVLSAKTGQITSAEALARWTHPDRGPIRPDIFISLAEECGLIDRLGEQLLRRACRDAQGWPDDVRVAVNLSPLQFLSGKVIETVQRALDESGIRADRLQLEVTEGLLIRDVEGTFHQLEKLRELGIQVLIDDFGVGYSSLSYFQRFTLDKVKIDKSFVDEIATSRAARAIVQAVVGLGAALDMGVVAEGIKTEEQRLLLLASGCTHLQGYLFSRPVTANTLGKMLVTPGNVEAMASKAA